MNEQQSARLFNEQLDRLLAAGDSSDQWPVEAAEPDLLATSTRLAALPGLLPAPDTAFEQRVWARVRAVERKPKQMERLLTWRPRMPRPGLRLLAPVAALLLVVLLVLPGPRQAVGNWMASFQIDGVEVVVAPDETERPELALQGQQFASLTEANTATAFGLLQPAYLPDGYALTGVETVSVNGLPDDLQPLYVEASYRPTDADPNVNSYAVLRQFNPAKQDNFKIGQIEFQSEGVRTASDVTLSNGQPAVLIAFEPAQGDDTILLRQLIWQENGLTLELWSEVLSAEEMLSIAQSIQPVADSQIR